MEEEEILDLVDEEDNDDDVELLMSILRKKRQVWKWEDGDGWYYSSNEQL